MLIVQKFGGSSVADKERIMNVAEIIAKTHNEGKKVVVILSAQGDTTDELLQKAAEISENPSEREVDMLLATGEQQSVALMAIALNSMGLPAVSLNAQQIGISTSSTHGNARVLNICGERIPAELEEGKIVLVTGFQGINEYGDITTLGRGGSDASAVAMAAALGAELCEIYTDVDGVYTADPRIVKNAGKLDQISYDEMLEMATLGAKVLHNRSVEMAKTHNVNMCVRSSITKAEGTRVVNSGDIERHAVVGVAGDLDVCLVAVREAKNETGSLYKLFSVLAGHGINVDIITQFKGDSFSEITFTVSKKDAEKTLKALNENKNHLAIETIKTDGSMAKVSAVGVGMASNPGVAAKMFEAIYECDSEIFLITTTEIKISVLVNAGDYVKVMNAVHEKFELGRTNQITK
ncbi:MAG: aspartate kinase [Synergistaceae bacterium]|nr:aspartate kinase [Synergistaceae bacterium]